MSNEAALICSEQAYIIHQLDALHKCTINACLWSMCLIDQEKWFICISNELCSVRDLHHFVQKYFPITKPHLCDLYAISYILIIDFEEFEKFVCACVCVPQFIHWFKGYYDCKSFWHIKSDACKHNRVLETNILCICAHNRTQRQTSSIFLTSIKRANY